MAEEETSSRARRNLGALERGVTHGRSALFCGLHARLVKLWRASGMGSLFDSSRRCGAQQGYRAYHSATIPSPKRGRHIHSHSVNLRYSELSNSLEIFKPIRPQTSTARGCRCLLNSATFSNRRKLM